jgi:hypothetical protein
VLRHDDMVDYIILLSFIALDMVHVGHPTHIYYLLAHSIMDTSHFMDGVIPSLFSWWIIVVDYHWLMESYFLFLYEPYEYPQNVINC